MQGRTITDSVFTRKEYNRLGFTESVHERYGKNQNLSRPLPFLSVAWPTGVQLLVFFCSSVPVMLFGTPGISGCRSQHVPVESSSLLHS